MYKINLNCLVHAYRPMKTSLIDRVILYDLIDTILSKKQTLSILRTCLIINFNYFY